MRSRKPKKILPPTRTRRTESSITQIQSISGTATRRIIYDTQLFPQKKPKIKIIQKPRRTPQKKPEPKGQFKGYGAQGYPKKTGSKKHKLDLKG